MQKCVPVTYSLTKHSVQSGTVNNRNEMRDGFLLEPSPILFHIAIVQLQFSRLKRTRTCTACWKTKKNQVLFSQ